MSKLGRSMNTITKAMNRMVSKLVDYNALPPTYGWRFQVSADITFMLDHAKEFTSLKIEVPQTLLSYQKRNNFNREKVFYFNLQLEIDFRIYFYIDHRLSLCYT